MKRMAVPQSTNCCGQACEFHMHSVGELHFCSKECQDAYPLSISGSALVLSDELQEQLSALRIRTTNEQLENDRQRRLIAKNRLDEERMRQCRQGLDEVANTLAEIGLSDPIEDPTNEAQQVADPIEQHTPSPAHLPNTKAGGAR